jgi:hypothetical protein
MRTKQSSIKLVLVAAALLAGGLLGSRANAQSSLAQSEFRGTFTLPYAVQWGKAVLPAGEYLLKFTGPDMPALLSIRDAKSLRSVTFEITDIREGRCKGESALIIGMRGDQAVVSALRIEELGETFVYPAPRTRERGAEEARAGHVIPVLVAEK